MGQAVKQTYGMTLDEFFAAFDSEPGKHVLVRGVPRLMSPAKPDHAIIQGNTLVIIAIHLRKLGGSCKAYPEAPISFRMFGHDNFRAPDILVDCSGMPTKGRAFEKPTVMVEVLSSSNEDETWETIQACSTIPSLKEILVLASLKIEAQVFRRAADGTWEDQPAEKKTSGAVTIEYLGLTLQLPEIYEGTTLV